MSSTVSKLQATTALIVIVNVGLVLAAILIPVYRSARAASARTNCMSNLKALAFGAELYTSDHDRLMEARRWSDVLPLEKEEHARFTCVRSSGIAFSYAMNAELSGRRWSMIYAPETRLLFFDSKVMVPNAFGNERLQPDPPRHDGRNMAVYVDGHARPLRMRPSGGE